MYATNRPSFACFKIKSELFSPDKYTSTTSKHICFYYIFNKESLDWNNISKIKKWERKNTVAT